MLSALVVVAALGAGGCKQGDGALPAKINDVPNRLGDLQRDLAAVVSGEQQAVQDLTDDLLVFTDEPEGKDATKALATKRARGVAGLSSAWLSANFWKYSNARMLSRFTPSPSAYMRPSFHSANP